MRQATRRFEYTGDFEYNTPSTRHVHAKYTAAMPLEAAPPLAAAHSISLACISMQEPFGSLLRR